MSTSPTDLSHPQRRGFRRWLPWMLGTAVVTVLLGWWLWPRTPPPAFTTASVDRGDIELRITASGTLSATVTVDVGSQVTGRIQELHADYNSVVSKGQIVAKIDPSLYQAQAAQQRANVLAAQGNLARTRAQAEDAHRQASRAKELASQQLLAQSDADTADTNAIAADAAVQQARGQLAQAQAALQLAETNIRYTDIISPTDGIVISRAVNQGQTVSASLSAPVLFTIAQDLRDMQVHAAVSEADIGRLQKGMKASFTVDAYPGDHFEGTINEIRNAATITSNIVTYDVVIDVRNPDLKLKPSMTANVTFIAARSENALRVPNSALRFKPSEQMLTALRAERDARTPNGGAPKAGADKPASQKADAAASGTPAEERPRQNRSGGSGGGPGSGMGGTGEVGGPRAGGEGRPNREGGRSGNRKPGDGSRVWVLQDGKPHPVRVKTGISDGSFTEILHGELTEGMTLITANAAAAADSTPRSQQQQQRRMPGMF